MVAVSGTLCYTCHNSNLRNSNREHLNYHQKAEFNFLTCHIEHVPIEIRWEHVRWSNTIWLGNIAIKIYRKTCCYFKLTNRERLNQVLDYHQRAKFDPLICHIENVPIKYSVINTAIKTYRNPKWRLRNQNVSFLHN